MAPLVSRDLAILDRVAPRPERSPEQPDARLFDPLVADMLRLGPLTRERFATPWGDTAALKALAHSKRAALDPALAVAMLEQHRRLGAPAASIQSLERLARGEVVCAVAGQQPAPLGGPLYALHKTACAVGLAEVVTERTGVPCVPLFWMHGEDSDFAEIRGATLADASLQIKETSLPPESHRDGGLVGSIGIEALAGPHAAALAAWEGLAGHADVSGLLGRIDARARDLGEACVALMLELFGSRGLIVVDPRLPAFRAAARPVFARYLARAEALSAAARDAGARLESSIGRRALNDATLESFAFELVGDTRHKRTIEEARRLGGNGVLSPSVALRPAVQDAVFPTVAMACGSAEILYLAQLREVFDGLGVAAASPVPRLTATWLPAAGRAMIEATGALAWDVVTATDRVLRLHAERAVPADLRSELESARSGVFGSLDRFAQSSTRVDASLPQMIESARGKIDFQFARLAEALTGKVRHKLERQHPEWARLRYYLLPGDKLQERRIASLEPVAHLGLGVAGELCTLAAEQARRLADGVHDHLLLTL